MGTNRIERTDSYVGGESAIWEFVIAGQDVDRKDISGGTGEWYLLDNRGDADSEALLDHSDSEVEVVIVSGENGKIEVRLDADATTQYAGSMKWHRLIVEDASGSTQIWNGRFPIQER